MVQRTIEDAATPTRIEGILHPDRERAKLQAPGLRVRARVQDRVRRNMRRNRARRR